MALVLPAQSLSRHERLSSRQAISIFLVSIVLGLVIGSVQSSYLLVDERENVAKTLDEIISLVMEPCAQAAYNIDIPNAKKLTNGLLAYHLISFVEIKDDFGRTLAAESEVSSDMQVGWLAERLFDGEGTLTVSLFYGDEKLNVGSLKVRIHQNRIASDLLRRIKMIFIGDLLHSVILACVIFVLLQSSLTVHLHNITHRLMQFSLDDSSGELLEVPKGHARDELGMLVSTINEMTDGLRQSTVSIETLGEEQKRFQDVTSTTGDWVWEVDKLGCLSYSSPVVEGILGYSSEQTLGQEYTGFAVPAGTQADSDEMRSLFFESESFRNFVHSKVAKSGVVVVLEASGVPVLDEAGKARGFRGSSRDITERRRAEEDLTQAFHKLKLTQQQLVQSEKMAGIGQLAAGVAHEINNPASFLMSNLETLRPNIAALLAVVAKLEALLNSIPVDDSDEAERVRQALAAIAEEHDLDYLREDLPELIEESLEGTYRIRNIVSSLKDFAHPGKVGFVLADLNHVVNKALMLVNNELKYKCEVVQQLGDLPEVFINPQKIEQVFINILVNAAQAIEEKGIISVKTYAANESVFIEITDDGVGIPKEMYEKIFDPFYTTKEVGKGTGLGLSIVYGIIGEHKGKVELSSTEGSGTTFVIEFPLRPGGDTSVVS